MNFGYLFYSNIIRANLLSKHLYKNIYHIPKIKNITLTLSFMNDNVPFDINVLYSLSLLELLSVQAAYIKKVKAVYRAKTKRLIFVVSITLRSKYSYELLYFFSLVSLPLFTTRYMDRNIHVDSRSKSYGFSFSDMNVFPFIPEVFYKWGHTMQVLILLSNISWPDSKHVPDHIDFFDHFHLLWKYEFPESDVKEEIEGQMKPRISINKQEEVKENEVFNL